MTDVAMQIKVPEIAFSTRGTSMHQSSGRNRNRRKRSHAAGVDAVESMSMAKSVSLIVCGV